MWMAREIRNSMVLPCLACVLCFRAMAAPATAAEPVTVFAAAGTTLAMQRIAECFEAESGIQVRLNFAASSTLARQIEAGAPACMYIAANPEWMDYLEERNVIQPETRRSLLANRLAWIVPAPGTGEAEREPRAEVEVLPRFEGRFVTGDPSHVPVGIYARQALEALGWWDAVSPRMLPTPDTRTALNTVALGEAAAGVVYRSDAVTSPRVRMLGLLPEESHPPIRFHVALCQGHGDAARQFLSFLDGPEARAIFAQCGFTWLPAHTMPEAPTAPGWKALSGVEREAVWLSLQVALWSMLLLTIPGVLCGWGLARLRFPGKALVEGLVHLPLVMPPVVTGYALLILLGNNGPLGGLFERWFGGGIAFTWYAAVLASMVMAFPLMVRSVRLAMEFIDRDLEEAARGLGAPPWWAFCTITLPLAAPGILGGMVLAFARSLGEFGATVTFAGNIRGETQTLPLAIFTQQQLPGGDAVTLRLALLAAVLSLAAVLLHQALAQHLQRRWQGDGHA